MRKLEQKSNGKAMRPISGVIPQRLYDELVGIGERETRSVSQLVHMALKEFISRRLKRKAA